MLEIGLKRCAPMGKLVVKTGDGLDSYPDPECARPDLLLGGSTLESA